MPDGFLFKPSAGRSANRVVKRFPTEEQYTTEDKSAKLQITSQLLSKFIGSAVETRPWLSQSCRRTKGVASPHALISTVLRSLGASATLDGTLGPLPEELAQNLGERAKPPQGGGYGESKFLTKMSLDQTKIETGYGAHW